MRDHFTILVADRNRYVREFLRRELAGEGYEIILAKSAQEILDLIHEKRDMHLLILDVGVPCAKELSILEKAENRVPPLPVVVHSFFSDYREYASQSDTTVFVEKTGSNVDQLKRVVSEMLEKAPNMQFDAEMNLEKQTDKGSVDSK
ncbi:MAG: response regulator [Deltaproteobacteria bacterium]|nr:response regulator [Deltaproteobacteria bacterium]